MYAPRHVVRSLSATANESLFNVSIYHSINEFLLRLLLVVVAVAKQQQLTAAAAAAAAAWSAWSSRYSWEYITGHGTLRSVNSL